MRDGILWLLIVVYAFVTVLADAFPKALSSPANLPLGIVIPLLFALVHGAVRYGAKGIFAFMVLCLGISNIMENMGVLTGFPFGRYHYTDVLGPKLFLVPLLIGPAYFGTGYLSWVLANLLLDADKRRDVLARIAVPVVATFIMVGWDLCLDPGSSTIGRIWVWHDGGPYFGVPFVNYLGWCLTVFLFLAAFSLYRARWPEPERAVPAAWWYQACALFAVMALDYPAGYLGIENRAVTDPTGRVWQTADILGTAAIASLFTMLFVAVTCLFVLLLRRRA
jgi:putative membrane protein